MGQAEGETAWKSNTKSGWKKMARSFLDKAEKNFCAPSMNFTASAPLQRILSMPYRAAWGRLKASEKRLGVKLVEMQTHGEGSSLTAAAKDLLRKFDQLEKETCTFLEEKGRKLSLIRPDEASGQTNEKIIRKLCCWINTAFIYTQSLHLLSHAIEYI